MTTKQLPYDRTIVPQETGFWCGPASIQVVLDSLGIKVAEPDIASKTEALEGNIGWDDRDGTDHVSQVATVLNEYTGAGYFVVEMPQDPPTGEQKERLWRDLVASINGGHGVVVNIVAPRGNYPQAVAPSTISPTYGGGTVYHYMSAMGYSDDGPRRVWIADSGFAPFGYWMSFDQLATLIPPKGYTAAPGPVPPAPAAVPAVGLTAETLSEAMGHTVPIERYRTLLPAFSAAMVAAGCTTVERAAMWCAQLGHESQGLRLFRELWGPTADQLTYDGRMGNGPGDGFRYRGRGAIQVTGRNHYTALSAWACDHGYVPTRTFFVDQPEALERDEYAFLGAVWYWTTQRPMNDLADARNLAGATRAINGGDNGIADRSVRYQRCLDMGAALLPTGGPVTTFIDAGVAQLHPTPGLLRTINRPQNINESTRDPNSAWPGAIWADIWNETVWDGYDIRPEYADVPDDVGRSAVGLLQTIAARQVRIEAKLDRLLGDK